VSAALTVVKLGGSLLADPERLRARLRRLAAGADGPCLIVPGGGPFADAVRAAQGALGFDDALAHRLALDAMGRMAEVFLDLEPELRIERTLPDQDVGGSRDEAPSPVRERVGVRDENSTDRAQRHRGDVQPHPNRSHPSPCPSPARERGPATGPGLARVWDPMALRAGHPDIPESWDVTSDSLALWLAGQVGAAACILVKSLGPPPGTGPAEWARLGLVDAAFPTFAARYRGTIRIEGPAEGRVAA